MDDYVIISSVQDHFHQSNASSVGETAGRQCLCMVLLTRIKLWGKYGLYVVLVCYFSTSPSVIKKFEETRLH